MALDKTAQLIANCEKPTTAMNSIGYTTVTLLGYPVSLYHDVLKDRPYTLAEDHPSLIPNRDPPYFQRSSSRTGSYSAVHSGRGLELFPV